MLDISDIKGHWTRVVDPIRVEAIRQIDQQQASDYETNLVFPNGRHIYEFNVSALAVAHDARIQHVLKTFVEIPDISQCPTVLENELDNALLSGVNAESLVQGALESIVIGKPTPEMNTLFYNSVRYEDDHFCRHGLPEDKVRTGVDNMPNRYIATSIEVLDLLGFR